MSDRSTPTSTSLEGLPSEAEITRTWPEDATPRISIVCTTFNHERYVEQALDGFLRQKTNFRFEILIHDDASTDSTRAIVERYAARYPRIVRTIFQTENQYSQGITSAAVAIAATEAEFVAFCEGDDYWIDPEKLQLQHDFLRAHPSYSLVFHNSVVRDDQSAPATDEIFGIFEKSTYTIEDVILRDWFIPSQSMVFRRDRLKLPCWFHKVFGMDVAMHLMLASTGEIGYLDRVMGVYRVNPSSVSRNRPAAFFQTAIIQTVCYFNFETGFRFDDLVNRRVEREREKVYFHFLRCRPRHIRFASADYFRFRLQAFRESRRKALLARDLTR